MVGRIHVWRLEMGEMETFALTGIVIALKAAGFEHDELQRP